MWPFNKPTVGVVCYGNILRSQVLSTYLRAGRAAHGCRYRIYDAGICLDPRTEFRDARASLREVEQQLHARGLHVRLRQTTWSDQVTRRLMNCTLILAADAEVVRVLNKRLPAEHPPVYQFYALLGEAEREFPDTYDYKRQAQIPEAFAASFDELERIVAKLLPILPEHLCDER